MRHHSFGTLQEIGMSVLALNFQTREHAVSSSSSGSLDGTIGNSLNSSRTKSNASSRSSGSWNCKLNVPQVFSCATFAFKSGSHHVDFVVVPSKLVNVAGGT